MMSIFHNAAEISGEFDLLRFGLNYALNHAIYPPKPKRHLVLTEELQARLEEEAIDVCVCLSILQGWLMQA